MGRTNRSRRRRDEMNRVKRERNAVKELIRLKKTLGLIDAQGNEIMKEVSDVVTVKSAKELKKEKRIKENENNLSEILEKEEKGEKVKVINEKTGKEHIYDTKTFKDQHGSYPVWYKPRKTAKKLRKIAHAKKQRFKQCWTVSNIPL